MCMRLVAACVLLVAVLTVPAAADVPATHDQAVAVATAINLVAADMPDYKATPPAPTTPAQRRADARSAKCSGIAPDSRALAAVDSDELDLPSDVDFEAAQSHVSVWSDPAQAQANINALRRRRARSCLAKSLARSLGKDVHVLRTSLKTIAPPVPGGVGLRVDLRVLTNGNRIRFRIDALGFARDNVEVGLITVGGPHPFPGERERRLVQLLVTRAQQQLP
jgi:hypothetical protein